MAASLAGYNLQISLVDGTTADTNIAVTGIATEDEIIFVGHFTTKAAIATLVDDTANCSITSAGNIQSATDTSNDLLQVFWIDKSK